MGFRLGIAHPERLEALIVQNAVAHEDGLGPLWQTRREFWADRQTHEAALRENFFSFDATRQRHVGTSPNAEELRPGSVDRRARVPRPARASGDVQGRDLSCRLPSRNGASYAAWPDCSANASRRYRSVWGRYDPASRWRRPRRTSGTCRTPRRTSSPATPRRRAARRDARIWPGNSAQRPPAPPGGERHFASSTLAVARCRCIAGVTDACRSSPPGRSIFGDRPPSPRTRCPSRQAGRSTSDSCGARDELFQVWPGVLSHRPT